MKTRVVFIGSTVAVLMAALIAGPVVAAGPASDRATARFEIRFMERTIEHHMMGVQMAEMCVAKATPPPPEGDATLKELCGSIAVTQAAEAKQLMMWLRQWYGIDFQPKMSGGMMNRLERLSGEAFDIAISEMFIKHHLGQIKASTKCLIRAEHVALQEFCQDTIDVQSAEIVQFRDILRQHGETFRGS